MTVIAWDGRSIAADKRAVNNALAVTTTKIRRVVIDGADVILAWAGDQGSGQAMAAWYAAGADPAKFPECQKDDELWARLIVADSAGAKFYERQPVAIQVEDGFAAWGSGRDFAMVALHLGKTPREAVEIASLFSLGCGNGVDSFDL